MSEEHRRTEASGIVGQEDGLWKASRFLCYFLYVFCIPPSQRLASAETERVLQWHGWGENSALPSGVVGEAHNDNELPREGQGLNGATPVVGFLVQSGGGGRGRADLPGFGS